MSLLVWLPLNGSLNNLGLSSSMFTNTGATIDNNGKIGQCYNFASGNFLQSTLSLSTTGPWSAAAWIYPTSTTSDGHLYIIGLNGTTASNFLFTLCIYLTKIAVRFAGTTYLAASTYTVNTWTHACFTYDGTNLKIYVNGILSKTFTSTVAPKAATNLYIGKRGGDAGYYTGKLNDVRIYDHCLSQKEVEEISKGLVLHYKLNENNLINSNILINTAFNSIYNLTTGWDTAKNGTILASSWGGYNSGVGNLATVYHAHLKQFEDLYVYEYIKTANESWLGISLGGLQSKLVAGLLYTFSWELYCASGSNYSHGGLYYYKTGASSANFHLGSFSGNTNRVLGLWQKFTYTFTAPSDGDYSKNMSWYIYGMNGGNGVIYLRHPKLELGAVATPWVPAEGGFINNIIYDSSGYLHDGTLNLNINVTNLTPRYNNSAIFNSNTISLSPIFFDDTNQCHTVSAWVYPTSSNDSVLINFNAGYKIFHSTTGKTLMYLNSGTNDSYVYGTALPLNTWTLITWVLNTSNLTCKVYYNGILNASSTNYTSTDIPSGINKNLIIGSGFTGYISDLRIYATVLTDALIKKLYDTSVTIDNLGNVHARELIEN